MTLKQNDKKNCTISANQTTCSKCYFETHFSHKYPKIIRNYDLLKAFKFNEKINNHFLNSYLNVKLTISRFNLICEIFDELIVINPDFYSRLESFENINSKLQFELPNFEFANKPKSKKSKVLKLIYLGRIENSKGIGKLIDFALRINNRFIQIDVYGQINDPKYDKIFLNEIQLKCETKFQYMGILNPRDVKDVLRQYDYLIHPSQIAEMTPLVIKEAFEVGLPVIGNDIFGINTYIKNGVNGWLLDFEDKNLCQNFYDVMHKPLTTQ
jgi:glycosyltransferase involved in cell wall biosynthesis